MSKQNLSGENTLTLIVTPAPRGAGRYQARLEGDDRVLCVSRTPFFSAARKLIAQGYDPDITLIMRHAGSDTHSLSAKLETAAALTVEETPYGPKFRRWKPFSTLAVSPRNASNKLAATDLAEPADCTPLAPTLPSITISKRQKVR
jgi:hypothetical protein